MYARVSSVELGCAAAMGGSAGKDRYVAACVRLERRGGQVKKKRQECGTRRKETGVAREMRRDAKWVGLKAASPLDWSSSAVGSGNFTRR
jgi:hypothetical protein